MFTVLMNHFYSGVGKLIAINIYDVCSVSLKDYLNEVKWYGAVRRRCGWDDLNA